jgi:hypothetical protein
MRDGELKGMSDPDVAYPPRDAAFDLTIDVAQHILENANVFHLLGDQPDFPGRERNRFLYLLLMFEEMGKLMNLIQECEKAAKADYINVRIENFNNDGLNGRKAAGQIFEELRTVESAASKLGKMQLKPFEEPAFLKDDFPHLVDSLLHVHIEGAETPDAPSDEQMDRFSEIIERNSLAGAEYIHDLAKALGLWVEIGITRSKEKSGPRYR